VLASLTRVPDVHVVAAHGLCLDEVTYPPDAEVALRASATRRVREVPT
jgi:tRNA pseudouridine38-40 synthase